jgi:phage terminase large subunit-like protein
LGERLVAEKLSSADLKKLADLHAQLKVAIKWYKIRTYQPYDWQREFHYAGADHPERMLMAANRVGKTMSAGAETTYHLTGDYPPDWKGRRFDEPVLWWTGSPTNESSRDIVQTELLGGLGVMLGSGWVPRSLIVGKPTTRQAGVKNVVDAFKVRHVSGGVSTCVLKTYEQGWQKWQGAAPHGVWLDEEPDNYMIYSEAQTRVITKSGIVMVTFTPLLGTTDLVEHFMDAKPNTGIYLKSASWDDAPHLSDKDKARLSNSYRAHERDARTKGIPMLGEGAVFPIPDDDIRVELFKVPDHWARIKGCDFGIDHPAAGVEIAWDRDQDVIYVIDTYKRAGQPSAFHAVWFNKANPLLPVAWPHDGMNREKSGGKTIAEGYRSHGVNMMSKSARYPKARGDLKDKGGPQPVEPIVDEVLERMVDGRFKVFANQTQWFEEKRSYHRKDGLIVPRRDDILKATFYAIMMKRYAVSLNTLNFRRPMAPKVPVATVRV